MRRSPAGTRVTWALLGGAVAGVIASLFTPISASILLGWDIAVLIYLVWTWSAVQGLDPEVTAQLANREDPSTPVADLVVIGAGTAMLAAVGFALAKAGEATGGMKAYLVTLGLVSVVLSWAVVHTVFALKYARAYYSEPAGGIEFNEDEPPNYIDFAYYAFTIGMTFQVADTNITSRAVRRTTLHHALLSYLFGSVLLGLVINVVATLLK
ncbi:MAG TPA: DUF1345 domain-containing protein [Streptosporangiaceae bacterium]|nr:DUF1345 domain-containing protein [Streptosporangiaceae bacterium]